jgi:hypothetical protein
MKTAASIALLLSAHLVTGITPAFSQDSTRADFDSFCKAMEGRWVGDVVWIADWPGIGKKGDRVTCYCEIRIAEDGNALIGKFYGGEGSGTWLTVYDAAKKEIRETGVNSGGTQTTHIYKKNGDGTWTDKMSGSNADGSTIKGEFFVEISDKGNRHSWSGKSMTGGKPNDPLQDVWRRVSNK